MQTESSWLSKSKHETVKRRWKCFQFGYSNSDLGPRLNKVLPLCADFSSTEPFSSDLPSPGQKILNPREFAQKYRHRLRLGHFQETNAFSNLFQTMEQIKKEAK